MTNKELWQLFPIILVEYQDNWKNDFSAENENIKTNILSESILRINHIGSTAVPGLLAKPTIDILLEIEKNANLDRLIHGMESIGYIFSLQPHKPSPHMMFMKGYTSEGFKPPVYHVHVRYLGDWDEIWFRNYLIRHSEIAKEYADLKLGLKEEFKHDRDGYTDAKTEFIRKITKLARHENNG